MLRSLYHGAWFALAMLAIAPACATDPASPVADVVAYCADDSTLAYVLDQPAYGFHVRSLPSASTSGRYPYRYELWSDGRLSGGGLYESRVVTTSDWDGDGASEIDTSATAWLMPLDAAGTWSVGGCGSSACLTFAFTYPWTEYAGRRWGSAFWQGAGPLRYSPPRDGRFTATYRDEFIDFDGSTTTESLTLEYVPCPR